MAAETRALPASFYEDALTEAERQDLPVALEIEGVDQEIAMLRLRLRTVLQGRPEDLPLMLRALDTLRRMIVTKYDLPAEDAKAMEARDGELRRELLKIFGGAGDDV